MILLRLLTFLLGLAVVVLTLRSAIRVLVVPRNESDRIARTVFLALRRIFDLRVRRALTYAERDRVMVLYAPLGLLLLPVAWLFLVLVGYIAMYWAIGVGSLATTLRVSGSSLFTLGFATVEETGTTLLVFSEAAIGLILIALLIAYLPTIYGAFSRREAAVTMLEVRAGSPPSAAEMILRYHRIHGLARLTDVWASWEMWFVDIEETHTSFAALPFFRSPQGHRSWVTAAGAVLDAASLYASTLDLPRDPQAELCIRAGYLALRHIADSFSLPYDPDPRPDDPISVTRPEYDEVCERFAAAGVPLKPNRDETWRHFAGWRVNYDTVLLGLATLTMAPEAPWSSDRSLRRLRPRPPSVSKTRGLAIRRLPSTKG